MMQIWHCILDIFIFHSTWLIKNFNLTDLQKSKKLEFFSMHNFSISTRHAPCTPKGHAPCTPKGHAKCQINDWFSRFEVYCIQAIRQTKYINIYSFKQKLTFLYKHLSNTNSLYKAIKKKIHIKIILCHWTILLNLCKPI